MSLVVRSILEDSNKLSIAVFVIVVVLVFIFVIIRDKINRKKAMNGEDHSNFIDMMKRATQNAPGYTYAYARWEETTYQGRTRTTKYWYYGIAFNREDLLIAAPLSIEDGDFGYKDLYRIDKSTVYCVNGFLKGKSPWVELYDKDLKPMISLMVEEENLKDDKYHPVNLLQPDEMNAFVEWAQNWMDDINVPNGLEITGKQKKPIKVKK